MSIVYENKLILVEKQDAVATVTLNNPPMNLNSIASMNELYDAFHKLEKDPEARVVILTGSGTRAFNVGTDLTEMRDMKGDYRGKKFNLEMALMDAIEFFPKPTICAVEGYCMGGGLELACCCDLRIASETSKFSQPEISLGVFPAAGGLYRLPRLIGQPKALEMMYTGEPIDAQTALSWGLVNHVVPIGETVTAAKELADKISKFAPSALRVIKEGMRKTWQKESKDNHYVNLEYIDPIFDGANAQEGIAAFIEKRKPEFDFGQ